MLPPPKCTSFGVILPCTSKIEAAANKYRRGIHFMSDVLWGETEGSRDLSWALLQIGRIKMVH
ncbi:hypothetical protein M405DRAFT_928837 [Rhizopogon salebrosus TDB-379]|nr:hypothetical protein M405DRAFT_928837 [Rhizopogon salebrosus TDB-379]